MGHAMKNTLFVILSFAISMSVAAREKTDSAQIFFRQGKYTLDPDFHLNRDALNKAQLILSDSTLRASGHRDVYITGAASPEGSVNLNYHLSDRRAKEISGYLNSRGLIDEDQLSLNFVGRDWKGLLTMVLQDPDVPYRAETISLIESIIDENSRTPVADRERLNHLGRLKAIGDGAAYDYLYRNAFPALRKTMLYVRYTYAPTYDPSLYIPGLDATVPPLYTHLEVPAFTASRKETRNFYMSVKTNLLYDAAALPSLGLEFYLGKNFSIAGEWTYGWWDNDSKHHYWRAYGGDISLRWWFGRKAHEKPLTGHHIGIYGGVTTYDFEFGNTGYMGGLPGRTLWDRCMHMAGVEYGYSLPIANRLNLDFTLGIGYLGGEYIKYIPHNDGYLWQSTRKLKWFGPTKAEISLVWLIGRGNQNKKGGSK